MASRPYEGELQLIRVIVGITLGGWLCTSVLYAAGRVKWDWIRKRFPRFRAAGTSGVACGSAESARRRSWCASRLDCALCCRWRVVRRAYLWLRIAASLLGSALWTLVFALIGYAAGEAAVRAVGHVGRAGEIIGALVVTAAVYAFIRWNRVRRAKKDERKRRKAQQGIAAP
ncbi:MAG: hypothetical protein IPP90_13355 [Gemmatimonadaceae bacterium]|nr:hypothetical protein [Gemmatimonadaceae bacterium]